MRRPPPAGASVREMRVVEMGTRLVALAALVAVGVVGGFVAFAVACVVFVMSATSAYMQGYREGR